MTKIVAFFEIFILLTCAVYLVIRVAKAITQKKPQEPEKETLCDTCEHLVHKGGDIESGKYKCGFEPEGFMNRLSIAGTTSCEMKRKNPRR